MSTTKTTQRYPFLDLLKIILTVGIVCRHAELVGLEGRSEAYDLLNRGLMLITEACVPLFFIISGFLYFRNVPEKVGANFFWKKTRSRFFSLVIPYLIANAFAFACYWLAHRYAPEMISGYFGDDWNKPFFIFWTGPINMSLWFIRDLIIACIVAPLIYLLVRYTRIWGVLALAAVWIWVGGSPWYNLWFTIGAWVAVCQGTAADRLLGKIRCRVPAHAAAWCFFIYLYHYIPAISLKKLFINLIDPQTFFTLVETYLATAGMVLAVMSGIFLMLREFAPRVTGVLVGGKL
jgi:fucose 4-O-acetylase-like acetyltransferase